MKKPTHFMGSSRKSIKACPKEVKRQIGFALYAAELGETLVASVPLVGFGGAKVLEVVVPHDGDAYRAIYTVKFRFAVYVLHVFQKKSKRGSKTPLPDMALVKARLKEAEQHYKAHYGKHEEKQAKAGEQGA
jgi:phage-related protein